MKTRQEAEWLLFEEVAEQLQELDHDELAELCAASMLKAVPWRIDRFLALLDQAEAEE